MLKERYDKFKKKSVYSISPKWIVPGKQIFNLYFCYSFFRCWKFGFQSEFIVFIAADWKVLHFITVFNFHFTEITSLYSQG